MVSPRWFWTLKPSQASYKCVNLWPHGPFVLERVETDLPLLCGPVCLHHNLTRVRNPGWGCLCSVSWGLCFPNVCVEVSEAASPQFGSLAVGSLDAPLDVKSVPLDMKHDKLVCVGLVPTRI